MLYKTRTYKFHLLRNAEKAKEYRSKYWQERGYTILSAEVSPQLDVYEWNMSLESYVLSDVYYKLTITFEEIK